MAVLTELEPTRDWLRDQTQYVAIALSARAILRSIPAIYLEVFEPKGHSEPASEKLFHLLCSLIFPLARVRTPRASTELASFLENRIYFHDQLDAAMLAFPLIINATDGTVFNLLDAFKKVVESANPRTLVADSALEVVSNSTNYDPRSRHRSLKEFNHDCDYLGIRGVGIEPNELISLSGLLDRPLWIDGVPNNTELQWEQTNAALLQSNKNWNIWAGWYGSTLSGPLITSNIVDKLTKIPDSVWAEGSEAVINAMAATQQVAEIIPDSPESSLKEFIQSEILESQIRQFGILEIYDRVEVAGFTSPKPSIRGRLNELVNEGAIQRVERGYYASLDYLQDDPVAEQPIDHPPYIPEQKLGLNFAISDDGKITFADSGLLDEETDTHQIIVMREVLLEALDELIARTARSNSLSHIHGIAEKYREAICVDVSSLSIERLYALGLRLDRVCNSYRTVSGASEFVTPDYATMECLDTVIALHGPIVLSTKKGQQLIQLSRDYNYSRETDLVYREKAKIFSETVASNESLFDADVIDAIDTANDGIAIGRYPDRASEVARTTNANVLSWTAMIAVGAIVPTAFAASIPGVALITISIETINACYLFLVQNNEVIRGLAATGSEELSWLPRLLDWFNYQKHKSKQFLKN